MASLPSLRLKMRPLTAERGGAPAALRRAPFSPCGGAALCCVRMRRAAAGCVMRPAGRESADLCSDAVQTAGSTERQRSPAERRLRRDRLRQRRRGERRERQSAALCRWLCPHPAAADPTAKCLCGTALPIVDRSTVTSPMLSTTCKASMELQHRAAAACASCRAVSVSDCCRLRMHGCSAVLQVQVVLWCVQDTVSSAISSTCTVQCHSSTTTEPAGSRLRLC